MQILQKIMCDIRKNNIIVKQHLDAIEDHNYDILPRFVELDEYCHIYVYQGM